MYRGHPAADDIRIIAQIGGAINDVVMHSEILYVYAVRHGHDTRAGELVQKWLQRNETRPRKWPTIEINIEHATPKNYEKKKRIVIERIPPHPPQVEFIRDEIEMADECRHLITLPSQRLRVMDIVDQRLGPQSYPAAWNDARHDGADE